MMENNFKISIVIPVYNAAKYVEKAVHSALVESEVGEILLVEDESPDNALQICRQIAETNPKVKLLQHPDKKNHGAAASRNLGIINAEFDYIAFLDADDFFLPGRFKKDKEIFTADNSIEGIYHAIAPVALNTVGEEKLSLWNGGMMTMDKYYAPEILFENMGPVGAGGFFSLNGLTIKRSVFAKIGMMDPKLSLSQDTDICIKMSAICKLVPGSLTEPVAMYGVHDLNRSHSREKLNANRPYLFYQLYLWGKEKKIDRKRIFLLWQRFYEYNNIINKLTRKQQIILLFKELLKSPFLITSRFYCKQLPIVSRILS